MHQFDSNDPVHLTPDFGSENLSLRKVVLESPSPRIVRFLGLGKVALSEFRTK